MSVDVIESTSAGSGGGGDVPSSSSSHQLMTMMIDDGDEDDGNEDASSRHRRLLATTDDTEIEMGRTEDAKKTVSPFIIFVDSKVREIQGFKDEFERLKSKKQTRSHVAKKITDARVDFVRRLIAKNCKQGMTNEVKPLQDILEAFVYISNQGVTLTQLTCPLVLQP
jgi:hypothetical protein